MNYINPKNWKFHDFIGWLLGAAAFFAVTFAIFVPTTQAGYVVTDSNGNEECVLEVNIDSSTDLATLDACEDEFIAWSSSAALGVAAVLLVALIAFAIYRIAAADEVMTRVWLIVGVIVATVLATIWARNLFDGDFVWEFFWRGLIASCVVLGTLLASTAYYQKNHDRNA